MRWGCNVVTKMNLKFYQVDAFTTERFKGNPAVVYPLESWLDDELMQNIAMEHNLSETAFFVKEDDVFHIRWFMPTVEVDMCGHATLATAYVLFEELDFQGDSIVFSSKSGLLRVRREDRLYMMDFPTQKLEKCETPKEITKAFGVETLACYKGMDYLVILENETDVKEANPNLEQLKKLDASIRGVTISAKSEKYDFVSRFFAPNVGVNEDPVTGSAFTQLIPYWSESLGKDRLCAKQLSKRGGEVFCELKEDRVSISGSAVLCLVGEMIL